MFTNWFLNNLQRGDSIAELKEQLDQINSSMSLIYWTEFLFFVVIGQFSAFLTPFLQILIKIKVPETSKRKNVVKCVVKTWVFKKN